MNTCENCKHWKPSDVNDGFGLCELIEDSIEPIIDSGYEGHSLEGIETSKYFGCNLWEEN